MRQNNVAAIALIVAAMALFAVSDMLVKLSTASIGSGQILLMLFMAGMIVFAILTRCAGHPLLSKAFFHPAVIIRNAGEVIGSLAFVTSLSLVPISVASAILQATPLAVTMGAALFLKEPVGWRRWTAVLAGFAGVLVIVRPGLDGFDTNVLLTVLAAAALAMRDVATRAVPANIASQQLSVYAYASMILPSLALMQMQGGWQPVAAPVGLFVACAAGVGVVAYYTLIVATRIGEMPTIAPFRYSRLVFALIIGLFVFAERPDALMLTGSAIVVGTGLYALYRERVRRKAFERDDPSLAKLASQRPQEPGRSRT